MLGPLMFGFHDGQTEAPKIQAQKVIDNTALCFIKEWCQNIAKNIFDRQK